LIDEGFIGRLKVAVTVVVQRPAEALSGVSEVMIGAAKFGLAPALEHPGVKISSRNAINQRLELLYLRMAVILLSLGNT
jgi:hypothetical protein